MVYTLKQARMLRDITQVDMANRLGICRDTYRSIEKNPEQATVEQAKKICDILGMKLENIFFGS